MECKSDLKYVVPFSPFSSFSHFHLLSPSFFLSFIIPNHPDQSERMHPCRRRLSRDEDGVSLRPLSHNIHSSSFILTLKWFHSLSLSLFNSIQFNSLSVSLPLSLSLILSLILSLSHSRQISSAKRDEVNEGFKILTVEEIWMLGMKTGRKDDVTLHDTFLLPSLSFLLPSPLSKHIFHCILSMVIYLSLNFSLHSIPCFHLNWNKEEESLFHFSRIVFSKFEKEERKPFEKKELFCELKSEMEWEK